MKWLTIVGMGEDGLEGLSPKAKLALDGAQNIVGSKRLLSMIAGSNAVQHEWPQPFSAVVAKLKPLRGTPTVVLATGDPMNYGAARKIFEFIPVEEATVLPGLSSFSLAAARMGWSLPDCDTFTIHGRPAANLEAFIQPDAKLIVLTEDGSSIVECARRLVARGFGDSQMTVLENMGGSAENSFTFTASVVHQRDWSPLNTLAIHCRAARDAKLWPRVPGLPDDDFDHDGKITKREIRAVTIAALMPAPDKFLWDVGAGSGAVAIEWMRSARGAEAFAIEHDEQQCVFIATNADRFGTPRLKLINGRAPEALSGLPGPDSVFIGGGLSDEGVFQAVWSRLKTGGHLVANVVTLEGQSKLYDLQEVHGGDLVSMDVSVLTQVGEMRAFRPRMNVVQWRVRKT